MHWLDEKINILKENSQYHEKALLSAVLTYVKQQEYRKEIQGSQLDGLMWRSKQK